MWRKLIGLEYTVEHVLAKLLKIPERLEQLFESKMVDRRFHTDCVGFHQTKAGEAETQALRAKEIARKLRELLS